jgi:glycosyltransferase involved in cell wall biosynthesis
MKILFVCGAGYVSGLEVVTLSLIEGLRKRGHDVRCITTTWGDGDFAARLKAKQITYIRLPVGFISKTLTWSAVWMTLDQLRMLPQLWFGYYRYTREFKPDIVVHSNFQHIFLLWLFLNHGRNFFHVHNAFSLTKFYQVLFRILSLRLVCFIGVSMFVADALMKLGIPKNKITFVHNGADISVSDQSSNIAISKITAGAANIDRSQVISIGIVGQIGEWKGHDDLFDALCLVKSQDINFVCSVFGRGDTTYIESLKGKLRKCGLADKVHWVGFIHHAEEIFSVLDICVVPSRVQEGFGMVAAEAACFGVPVIATDRGGLSEVVCDGKTGFLVEANSPNQIAEKLGTLIQDQDLRKKIGSAAREWFMAHFTQDKMAEKMEHIFQKN